MTSRFDLPSIPLPDPVVALDSAVRSTGRRLLDRYPDLETSMLVARDYYVRTYIGLRTVHNEVRYDAPPDPYRLITVDPADIERFVEFGESKFLHAGRVVGGDWDRGDNRFADKDVYRAYVRHFEEGVPWSETEFYGRVVEQLENGTEMWGCRSEAEFRERCDRLDDLFTVIESEGYRSQAELLEDDVDPMENNRRAWLLTERLKDEIAVHIARDGEIVFADGRNRLSMVKVLDVDTIPVRVLRRHAGWQDVRDAYVRGEEHVAHHDGHPDLEALEFDSV